MDLANISQAPILLDEPTLHREHLYLSSLIGDWIVKGTQGEASLENTGERIYGSETYEWLEGGFFLVFHWERTLLARRHTGVGFLGFDVESNNFVCHSCDSMGYARTYKVEARDLNIKFIGKHDRAEFIVKFDGLSIDVIWEAQTDSGDWQSLYQYQLNRRPLS